MIKFPNASESFKKRNPHLYGMDELQAGQPKPASSSSLDRGQPKQIKRAQGVEVRVTLIAHRKRMLDDDNSTASLKWTRDAIANSLGIDDGDKRIVFETHQIETKGCEGVMVKIEG